jgi:hypothetical protein
VKEEDVYVIEPGEKSCVKAEEVKLVVVTRPDWYEEQCEIIEE